MNESGWLGKLASFPSLLWEFLLNSAENALSKHLGFLEEQHKFTLEKFLILEFIHSRVAMLGSLVQHKFKASEWIPTLSITTSMTTTPFAFVMSN